MASELKARPILALPCLIFTWDSPRRAAIFNFVYQEKYQDDDGNDNHTRYHHLPGGVASVRGRHYQRQGEYTRVVMATVDVLLVLLLVRKLPVL